MPPESKTNSSQQIGFIQTHSKRGPFKSAQIPLKSSKRVNHTVNGLPLENNNMSTGVIK